MPQTTASDGAGQNHTIAMLTGTAKTNAQSAATFRPRDIRVM
jgi:hypothetical protein